MYSPNQLTGAQVQDMSVNMSGNGEASAPENFHYNVYFVVGLLNELDLSK